MAICEQELERIAKSNLSGGLFSRRLMAQGILDLLRELRSLRKETSAEPTYREMTPPEAAEAMQSGRVLNADGNSFTILAVYREGLKLKAMTDLTHHERAE
jgi:hypothetical protein